MNTRVLYIMMSRHPDKTANVVLFLVVLVCFFVCLSVCLFVCLLEYYRKWLHLLS